MKANFGLFTKFAVLPQHPPQCRSLPHDCQFVLQPTIEHNQVATYILEIAFCLIQNLFKIRILNVDRSVSRFSEHPFIRFYSVKGGC